MITGRKLRIYNIRAGRKKPGTRAHIKAAALPDEKLEGELLRFGTSADRGSGTIDAIFRLTNPGGRLRPEMRAEFSVVLSKRAGVTSVPRAALQGDAASRFVYVADFELKNVHQRIRKRLEVTVTAALHRTDEPFAFQASLFVAPLSVD